MISFVHRIYVVSITLLDGDQIKYELSLILSKSRNYCSHSVLVSSNILPFFCL